MMWVRGEAPSQLKAKAEKAARDHAMTFEGWLETNQIYRITWEDRPTGQMVEKLGPLGLGSVWVEEWGTVKIKTPATEEEMRKRYDEEMRLRIYRAKRERDGSTKSYLPSHSKTYNVTRDKNNVTHDEYNRHTFKEVW